MTSNLSANCLLRIDSVYLKAIHSKSANRVPVAGTLLNMSHLGNPDILE